MENKKLSVSFDIETDLFDEINSKLSYLVNKIDNLESTYVSLNTNLIEQNIKMSEIINGKLEEPTFSSPEAEKELYYYINNDFIIVYGPGTFDNKSKLTKFGNWNMNNKTWDLKIGKELLLETFPSIIFKNKENNSMFIDE
tara:strand:- start:4862 stop:5284 length:423 start_codon:yes stop_codon:yes gene_type:complete